MTKSYFAAGGRADYPVSLLLNADVVVTVEDENATAALWIHPNPVPPNGSPRPCSRMSAHCGLGCGHGIRS